SRTDPSISTVTTTSHTPRTLPHLRNLFSILMNDLETAEDDENSVEENEATLVLFDCLLTTFPNDTCTTQTTAHDQIKQDEARAAESLFPAPRLHSTAQKRRRRCHRWGVSSGGGRNAFLLRNDSVGSDSDSNSDYSDPEDSDREDDDYFDTWHVDDDESEGSDDESEEEGGAGLGYEMRRTSVVRRSGGGGPGVGERVGGTARVRRSDDETASGAGDGERRRKRVRVGVVDEGDSEEGSAGGDVSVRGTEGGEGESEEEPDEDEVLERIYRRDM
ncbi:hypothetical protein HK102_002679, partial [Quaeritorhiza haematococci]